MYLHVLDKCVHPHTHTHDVHILIKPQAVQRLPGHPLARLPGRVRRAGGPAGGRGAAPAAGRVHLSTACLSGLRTGSVEGSSPACARIVLVPYKRTASRHGGTATGAVALPPVCPTVCMRACVQEWNRRPRAPFQPFDKLPGSPERAGPRAWALGERLLFLPSPILRVSAWYRYHLHLNLFTLGMFFDTKSFKFEIVDSSLCFIVKI